MRGGNAHIQEKCSGSAATVSAGGVERDAVRHAADGKRLDQCLTVRVAPYAARVALDLFLIGRTCGKAVHVGPLSNDRFSVGRLDDGIAAAVPN